MKNEQAALVQQVRAFMQQLRPEALKNGAWFLALLNQAYHSYDHAGRAEHFKTKYAHLSREELVERLALYAERSSGLGGAMAGWAFSVTQLAWLTSFGATSAFLLVTASTEVFYLLWLQTQLIFDLAQIYDLALNPNEPDDLLLIFAYTIGLEPDEFIGKGLDTATNNSAKKLALIYASRGAVEGLKDFSQIVGVRILQQTALRYIVPVASVVIGGAYNYVTTRELARVANQRLAKRARAVQVIRQVIVPQAFDKTVFTQALLYFAQADGRYSSGKHEIFRILTGILDLPVLEESQFLADEAAFLAALTAVESGQTAFLRAFSLLGIYEGQLADADAQLLEQAAQALRLDLNQDAILREESFYYVPQVPTWWEKAQSVWKKRK